jgi:hypothetical protein
VGELRRLRIATKQLMLFQIQRNTEMKILRLELTGTADKRDGSSCAVGAENVTAIFGSGIDTAPTEHVRRHQIGHHQIA